MNKLLISACVMCFAVAAPTVLMADDKDHHDNKGATQTHSTPGPSGGTHDTMMKHDSMSGGGMGSTHRSYHRTNRTVHTDKTVIDNHTNIHTNVHVDISTYHKNVTAERHFHWGDYHAPSGYSYKRWGYGDHIDAVYYGRDYWITNYLNFGLEAPPDDCVWVRYGPDALLIDEDTGEIVQVQYGLFY